MTTSSFRVSTLAAAFSLLAAAAGAQAPTGQSQPPASTPSSDTRAATTTFYGDTGLWFVPTAEVLAQKKWSVTGYRRGTNYIEGYTNVGDFAGTFAVGIRNRAEIFTSFLVDTRIDRDVRPLFVAAHPEYGSFVDRYPGVTQQWTGDNVGDWYIGGKVNLRSEADQHPAAYAVRGVVKVPTGDDAVGVSTGQTDFFVDFIGSKHVRQRVEVAGYGGYEWRGEPDGYDLPSSAFRWGVGAGFPSRSPVRLQTEVTGLVIGNEASQSVGLRGADGSLAPATSEVENLTRAHIGVTYQHAKGFFAGAGLAWTLPTEGRTVANSEGGDEPAGDYWDMQFRIGYHPGVRVYVPPPPPAPPPPPPPPPQVHNLTVTAACDPCTVEIGQRSTVTATATSSIGCAVTYRWTAPSGTFANATDRQTVWTAGQEAATVPVTVTVTCPTDNRTASATVNLQVVRPTPKVYTFEDVHFDFDRYSLRPEATRVLDEAVTALRDDPTLRIQIEGHTCNIGTAEYNLALGDRRATAVRDYLTSRGVTADRLTTVSYGEERPKYDNSREETRRLNRRAALTVNLQR
jgi:outer membrane protein OmpA-like peptidoglycan-associated protein